MIDQSALTESLKLASELNGKLDQLLNLNNQVISSLPQSEQAKVSFVVKDINEIKKAVKNGDMDVLTRLTQKYADSSKK